MKGNPIPVEFYNGLLIVGSLNPTLRKTQLHNGFTALDASLRCSQARMKASRFGRLLQTPYDLHTYSEPKD